MRSLGLRQAHYFAAARAGARRVLPRPLFDFVDGGADDEITLRENHAVCERVTFRPRAGLSVPEPDLTTTVLGASPSMPVALARTDPTPPGPRHDLLGQASR